VFETSASFEVFDREFDCGVLAMEPVDVDDITVEVSEERMVSPVGPQFLLRLLGEAGPANDHATRDSLGSLPGRVGAFGDFGFAVAGVFDPLPRGLRNRGDRGLDRTDIGSDRHRVTHIEPGEVDDRVVVPEPRIEPERQRSGQVIAAGPSDEFVDETFRAALNVCRTVTESAVQDLAVAAIVASNG
jgi:hypothetical protein